MGDGIVWLWFRTAGGNSTPLLFLVLEGASGLFQVQALQTLLYLSPRFPPVYDAGVRYFAALVRRKGSF